MKEIRILITSCLGKTGSILANQLKKSKYFNYEIFGSDNRETNIKVENYNKIFRVPLGEDKNYIDTLLNILIENKIRFILAGSDEEAISLSNNINILNKLKITSIVSDKEQLYLIRNKYQTYSYLKSKNIHVPDHHLITNKIEFNKALKLSGYPKKNLVIKPCSGRGGRGVFYLKGLGSIPKWINNGERTEIINNSNDILEIFDNKNEFILMPLLNSPCYDVDILKIHSSTKKYECVIRKRINPNGIPYRGYELIKNSNLENYVFSIYEKLNLKSLHDFDIMTDENGQPVLLEVNPRPSGSLVVSHMAGVPIIDLAIANQLKVKIDYVPFNNKSLYINF